jgi:DNA-binding transcriptional LysR family regulator
MFDDELFVSSPGGYEPTHRCSVIYASLKEVLPKIEAMFGDPKIELAKVTDLFRIECTDLFATVLIPQLIVLVAQQAPGIRIDVIPRELGFERITANKVDLAMAPSSDFKPSSESRETTRILEMETLFRAETVCMVRASHPLATSRMTLSKYLKAQHVLLFPMQGGRHTPDPFISLEQRFQMLGREPDVRVRVPYFASLGPILENTDLVATVPLLIARRLESKKICIISSPREFKAAAYAQIWHTRNTLMPVHSWLRKMIRNLAEQLG